MPGGAGPAAYEEAFREHLRRLARVGRLGPNVVAIGPWWKTDGQDEIDAVVLAEPDHARVPVLVGEATWAKTVNAARLRARLFEKAASLTAERDRLSYAICAREAITHADPDVLTITADDIFATEPR